LATVTVIGLGIAVYVALLGAQFPIQRGEDVLNVGGNIGQKAPAFRLSALGGGQLESRELDGKPTVLWFMAAWCPTCVEQSLALRQIKQDFNDSVNIVAIDLWVPSTLEAWKERGTLPAPAETTAELGAFKEKFGGDWFWTFDTDQVTFRYGILYVDTTILVDAEGVVAYRWDGPTGYGALARAIKEVV
jgi:peroxiredoxin